METVEAGSTPVMHSEFTSDLTGETDSSLEIALEIETSTKRKDMKAGTKFTFGAKLSVMMKVTLVMLVVGLLEFGAGPVPPLA